MKKAVSFLDLLTLMIILFGCSKQKNEISQKDIEEGKQEIVHGLFMTGDTEKS